MFNLFKRKHTHAFKLTGRGDKITQLNYVNIVEGITECACGKQRIAVQFTTSRKVGRGFIIIVPKVK